jgi:hypothetical protein
VAVNDEGVLKEKFKKKLFTLLFLKVAQAG